MSQKMNQIFLNGVSVEDLLEQISRLIDCKLGLLSPKEKNQENEYITRADTAKLLKITLPTLHEWSKIGYLKSYKIGSRVLYKKCEVIQTLENLPSFKHKKGASLLTLNHNPMKTLVEKPLSSNGFNNSATIPTPLKSKGGGK
jgi:hypothetical protein